ncbi:hypothetical protein ElyMa_000561600 [Elysia marginata]|uniref:Uncharacterized protein n=1 Tax=Elysia marginata TaxID=1093978 RepID=A0AAV4G3X0_9GAST|nr:hypothetical protein ElyMa_000561600 [Elysia marginata]
MDQMFSLLTVLCVITYCQGAELSMRRVAAHYVRGICGFLSCREDIRTSDSSTPDKDQGGSSVSYKSIWNMSLYQRHPINANSQHDVLLGSVSSTVPRLRDYSDRMKIGGYRGTTGAVVDVEFFKQEDCQGQFVCFIRGADALGKEVVSSVTLVQQKDQEGNKMVKANVTESTSLLASVQQMADGVGNKIWTKIISVESKMKNKLVSAENSIEHLQKVLATRKKNFKNKINNEIEQLQSEITAGSASLEKDLDDLFGAIAKRLKQITDQPRNEMVRNVSHSLDSIAQTLHEQQRQSLEKAFEGIEETVNSETAVLLTSMEAEVGLLKTYGEMNLDIVRNETDAIGEILTSEEMKTRCLPDDSVSMIEKVKKYLNLYILYHWQDVDFLRSEVPLVAR